MPSTSGASQFLERYGDQTIHCNPYVLAKLGIDKAHCFVKIDDYMILCTPYELGFRKSLFIAALSKQEMGFFQKYINGIVGLSLSFASQSGKAHDNVKFLIHCNLAGITPVEGKDNIGIFELVYKAASDDLVVMFGNFLDTQNRIKNLYDTLANSPVKMTPETAKRLGYNLFGTIAEPNTEPKRIQVYLLSSKNIEHLEAEGSNIRTPGSAVVYQLFFRKYRVTVAGNIQSCTQLANGLVKTAATLSFSAELVEILDDYFEVLNGK
ncbi:MAG: hypothetical protein LBH44_07370 [Treponema sp.]|jgi:hypothetical protein|nr:hypothetical protein [Treponema sp.]